MAHVELDVFDLVGQQELVDLSACAFSLDGSSHCLTSGSLHHLGLDEVLLEKKLVLSISDIVLELSHNLLHFLDIIEFEIID